MKIKSIGIGIATSGGNKESTTVSTKTIVFSKPASREVPCICKQLAYQT